MVECSGKLLIGHGMQAEFLFKALSPALESRADAHSQRRSKGTQQRQMLSVFGQLSSFRVQVANGT
jgi:hypothetical protein